MHNSVINISDRKPMCTYLLWSRLRVLVANTASICLVKTKTDMRLTYISVHFISLSPGMQCCSVSQPCHSDPILCLLIGLHWSKVMANPDPCWYNQANDGRLVRYFTAFFTAAGTSGCPFNDLSSSLLPLVLSLSLHHHSLHSFSVFLYCFLLFFHLLPILYSIFKSLSL